MFLIVLASAGKAQDRCGAELYQKELVKRNQQRETKDDFEKWINERRRLRRGARTQATLQVPVVVHVIHNGEAVGSGTNISDAQILSQIAVLNKDYNRENTDAGNTPAEFLPVAAGLDIEFVLARQDPEGLATTGIVRVQGTQNAWTMYDNYTLKALSYWPAEDYLNIWVCRLTDFLGYAQFPVSALPGMENSSTNRLTDGVVISHTAFGSIDDGAFVLHNSFNKGRTATHEIGHFLGLNHIWGDDDGSCVGTDYVDDTPNQAGNTSGCPAHPRVTCSTTNMFQNYLDYTNDACMNLFTAGQVARMEVVMGNSPRRASLTVSHGLNDPAPAANDLGLKKIVSPGAGVCPTAFTPELEVRNYGSNTITSARIRLRKDGSIIETKDFNFSPAMTPLQEQTITFASLAYTSGDHSISFEVLQTNGVTDGTAGNNTLSHTFTVPADIDLPFIAGFNTLPDDWLVVNPDQFITWTLASTNANTNTALKYDSYNYEDHVGEIDALITPMFDLSSAPAALLRFDVAYAQFQSSNEGLKVILLSGCNTDVTSGTVIYDKSGSTLATTAAVSSEFTPTGSQWRTEVIDLTSYAGQANLQLAFVATNDWGNNLYLDNIGLTASAIFDVAARRITQPSPVTCNNTVIPVVEVFNAGTLITDLTVTVHVNGSSVSRVFSLTLPGNTTTDLQLDEIQLQEGENELTITLSSPNGESDFFPDNNSLSMIVVQNATDDVLPLRQRFDAGIDPWTIASPTSSLSWEPVVLEGNNALYVHGFTALSEEAEAWLVSPVLDFSNVHEASLYFDYAYALRAGSADNFVVAASRDCGNTYTEVLYEADASTLAMGKQSEVDWRPTTSADWNTQPVDLASLAGASDVRIALIFTGSHGNNFYIDNIEFFLDSDPIRSGEPLVVYPTVPTDGIVNATFNLPDRTDIRIDIIDNTGRIVETYRETDVLNQTFSLNAGQRSGLYYVRAITPAGVYVGRYIVR